MQDVFKNLLIEHKLDALFVSNPLNSYYLLGYKTISPDDRDLWTLITKKNIYAFTHDLNFPLLQEHMQTTVFTPLLMNQKNPMTDKITSIIKKEKIKSIGIEAEDMRVGELQLFQKKIGKSTPGLSWKKTQRLILSLRAIKDQREIGLLRHAAHLADQALVEIAKTIKPGQTEFEIAKRLNAWFREKGSEPSFDPIVAIDKNSAVPHYDSSLNHGKVTPGCLILIDYGVIYKGYCSDTTRVLFYESASQEKKNMYQALLKAQEETIEKIPHFTRNDMGGVRNDKKESAKELDLYCRSILKVQRVPDEYPHVTGHGVGLQVHESPTIHFRSKDMLEKNQVITIEPGIYFAGKYGMRIEDTVAIGDKKVEVLSKFPKTLQII